MSRVTLAVRVRPFMESELREKLSDPVVKVEDENTVSITNFKVAASGAGDSRLRVRRYHADFCLDTSCAPDLPNYASQETVYESVGRSVLSTVCGGRSACVLAYGQSATGKTHTMLGSAQQPGLVPRLCRDLASQGRPLTVSFLEIYNERVRDLLSEDSAPSIGAGAGFNSLPRRKGNAVKDLRVREHPTKGPYVQNLRRVVVRDEGALLALVWAGAARRRSAATRRNPTSSRSHAVLQLHTADAHLHLADLAGSEKGGVGGVYRGRQKEGANINKSLVALSNVISALVVGGGRSRYVPYRDSALTWLLKDCFTGGAATFILATVSPSSSCYGESASTLRWAARTRQLPEGRGFVPSPTTNQSANNALSQQLAAIKSALTRHHISYTPETGELIHDPAFWIFRFDSLKSNKSELEESKEKEMDSKIAPVTSEVNRFGSNDSSITSSSSDRIEDKHTRSSGVAKNSLELVFGPALERTVSDMKVSAPLKNKRRQYRSHDILPIGQSKGNACLNPVNQNTNMLGNTEPKRAEKPSVISGESNKTNTSKIHVPFEMENPRAEIVASVTERLYTKKKEEQQEAKTGTVADKKIMEPLQELKICTNARQRLFEMSQRALKTRRKIGIPAHTQTQIRAIRMKDETIDIQRDLEPYCIKFDGTCKYYLDVATETKSTTPRCREAAIGSGSVGCQDSCTITDEPAFKSQAAMTDEFRTSEISTQTQEVSPQMKSFSAFTKYLSTNHNASNEEMSNTPIINIRISQSYPVEEEYISDDSLDSCIEDKSTRAVPPDLLTNHNSAEQDRQLSPVAAVQPENIALDMPSQCNGNYNKENQYASNNDEKDVESEATRTTSKSITPINVPSTVKKLFSCNEESGYKSLSDSKPGAGGLNGMPLGTNKYIYPYNSALSSLEEKAKNVKKIITFETDKSHHTDQSAILSVGTQTVFSKKNFACTTSSEATDIESEGCSELTRNVAKMKTLYYIRPLSRECKEFYNSVKLPSSKNRRLQDINHVHKNNILTKRAYRFFEGSLRNTSPQITQVNKQHVKLDSVKNIFCDRSLNMMRNSFKYEDCNNFQYGVCENRIGQTKKWPKNKSFCYADLERKIEDSCDRLERSICNHEEYVNGTDKRRASRFALTSQQSPSDYLQHLIHVRRNLVRANDERRTSDADLD